MNFFERFSILESYNLDKTILEKKYFDLQMLYHPDKAIDNSEKQKFLNISIEVNEGYKILKDDYSRAIYLLKINGINIDSLSLPIDVLENIWKKNQDFENITSSSVDSFLNDLINEKNDLEKVISSSFLEKNYNLAAIRVMEMKYLLNLINKVKDSALL